MNLIEIVKGMANAGEAINENFKKLGFEVAENSSGAYFKHPSGLMICIRKIAFKQTTNQVSANLFRTPDPLSREFPAEFSEAPYVDGSLLIPTASWVTMGTSATGWNAIRVYSPYNNQIIDDLILFAIGFAKE